LLFLGSFRQMLGISCLDYAATASFNFFLIHQSPGAVWSRLTAPLNKIKINVYQFWPQLVEKVVSITHFFCVLLPPVDFEQSIGILCVCMLMCSVPDTISAVFKSSDPVIFPSNRSIFVENLTETFHNIRPNELR
jgi:hypothetical protein